VSVFSITAAQKGCTNTRRAVYTDSIFGRVRPTPKSCLGRQLTSFETAQSLCGSWTSFTFSTV